MEWFVLRQGHIGWGYRSAHASGARVCAVSICYRLPVHWSSCLPHGGTSEVRLIPKILSRLLWFLRRTAALLRQIRTFPQLFRFCSDFGNSGIRQIVGKSMLTGRWWEGPILISLCGKTNVRNCNLLQRDFFARCRTVLGMAKGFFWRVWWNLEKDETPKRCDFWRLRKMLLKATFPSPSHNSGWSKRHQQPWKRGWPFDRRDKSYWSV